MHIQAGGKAFHLELVQQSVCALVQDIQPSPGRPDGGAAAESDLVEWQHCLYQLPGLSAYAHSPHQ